LLPICRGNLLTKSLGDIVSKDDFVIDSEYLTTILVVVPKYLYKEWQAIYETGTTIATSKIKA